MNSAITRKLFLGFFITSLITVGIFVVVAKWSFDHGLINYVDRVEEQQVMGLKFELEQLYEEWDGWNFLDHRSSSWQRLVNQKIRGGHRGGLDRAVNPDHDIKNKDGQRKKKNKDEFSRSRHPPPLPGSVQSRLFLLDKSGRILFGNPRTEAAGKKFELNVNQLTIGHIILAPRHKIGGALEIELRQSTIKALYLVALLVLAISALVAMLFSRQLLQPIKAITAAARSLAGGDFETRVPRYSNDELGQLSDDFNTLAKTLKSNLESRHQWVADISHELRTPLAILQGELEAMQDGLRPINSENIASLHEETMRLNSLVNDLYALSLSDAGALSYDKRPVNLSGVVDTVVSEFKSRIYSAKLVLEKNFDVSQSVIIFADEDKIVQLLTNLLENSIRYTDSPGIVRIDLKAEGGDAILSVEDSAPGVATPDLGKLFDRLFRVNRSRNRHHGGAGLGLTISKNIVEAHEGTIIAKISELGGLLIEVKLPLSDLQ